MSSTRTDFSRGGPPAGNSVHETCMFQRIPCMDACVMHDPCMVHAQSTIPCMELAWFSLPCMIHAEPPPSMHEACMVLPSMHDTPDTVNNNFGSKNSKQLQRTAAQFFSNFCEVCSLVPRLSQRANAFPYCKRRKAGWGLGTRL